VNVFAWRRPQLPDGADGGELLDDYVAAEDALRAFTDRNFGRMCAICARWTLYAAQVNAAADEAPALEDESRASIPPRPSSPVLPQREAGGGVSWRLQSWVANCCNANHALESMSDDSLAGVVASREVGRQWWRKVERAAGAPCAALTETGCSLQRGRPELCNRYFCEGVRDYLWALGGDGHGPQLAAQLDELQRCWAALYTAYQDAIKTIRIQSATGVDGRAGVTQGVVPRGDAATATSDPSPPTAARLTNVAYRRRERLRASSHWADFFRFLEQFDAAIARHARPVSAVELTDQFFKVNGDREAYVPFFAREAAAIGGRIRAD
jgi:hypothetical protein